MEKQRTTAKDRMQDVLSALGVSASEFENKCGLAHGFVARVTYVITKKTRARIKGAYPDLNIEYIANGTGEIFLKGEEAAESIKDRIMQFYDYMSINKLEFVKKTGISKSFVSNMSDNVRKSSLEKIYRAYPLLNPEWLEYGEGEMMLKKAKKQNTDDVVGRIDALIDFLGLTKVAFRSEVEMSPTSKNITKKTIDKIVKRYPFVNPLWLMHGTGQMITQQPKPVKTKFSYAPLVSQRAFAGYLTGFGDDEYLDSLDKIPYIEDSETRGNVIAIEVSGDSMDDGSVNAYQNGDIILAKEVLTTDPLPIHRYDFVIVHKSGILIKQIIAEDKAKGTITIHSLNEFYGDVEIDTKDIMKLFVVTMRMSKRKR